MKKLLLLIILFLLSCESSDYGLDVNENIGAFAYYDNVAFAWEALIDTKYEDASIYFNLALKDKIEPYHNSAHVGLGWTYLLYSNSLIGNNDLFQTYRDSISDKFNYDVNENPDAINRYIQYCPHSFCCDTGDCFSKDRLLGKLIYDIENHYLFTPNPDSLNSYITYLEDFIINNPNYNLMDGKPNGTSGQILNIDINNVVVYLAQIYLKESRFFDVCNLLNIHMMSCEDDCSDINMNSFLQCIQSFSSF